MLLNKEAQKLREEEAASGIDVEQSEFDVLLEELLEREKEGKSRIEALKKCTKSSQKQRKAEYKQTKHNEPDRPEICKFPKCFRRA